MMMLMLIFSSSWDLDRCDSVLRMRLRFFLFVFTTALAVWVPKGHRWCVHLSFLNVAHYIPEYCKIYLFPLSIIVLMYSFRISQGQQDDLVSLIDGLSELQLH